MSKEFPLVPIEVKPVSTKWRQLSGTIPNDETVQEINKLWAATVFCSVLLLLFICSFGLLLLLGASCWSLMKPKIVKVPNYSLGWDSLNQKFV